MNLDKLKFDEKGLIPAVIQEAGTKQVLMVAYMNRESLAKTLETGTTWFYSRSRQELWHKGATSGHTQWVRSIDTDCDQDTLLVQVIQEGAACHTGSHSCFFNSLQAPDTLPAPVIGEVLPRLEALIKERQAHPVEGSYTNYLFREGIDKILKKVGEEATEVVIASKNPNPEELVYEASDLLYHLAVLLVQKGLSYEDLAAQLAKRFK